MKLSTVLLLLCATLLLLAGFSAGRECYRGLKKEEIMSNGRRSSVLLVKDRDPNHYWVAIVYTGLLGVGMLVGGALLVRKAFK